MLDRLSLRYRIALVIFVAELLMLAVVLGVTLSQTRATADEFNAASQQATIALLSNLGVSALLTGDYADFQLYIEDVQKQPSVSRVVLADSAARVVAGSTVTDVGRPFGDVVPVSAAGWVVQPVVTAAGTLGTLAVAFSDAALNAAYRRTQATATTVAVAGMGLVALLGVVAGFALTRRLSQLGGAVQRFAAGDLTVRAQLGGQDEVAALARSFDEMADAVTRQQARIREQGEYTQMLMDSTSEAIYGSDLEGRFTFVNAAAVRMLGYDRADELIGRPIHETIHHHHADGRPYPLEECRIRNQARARLAAHADDEVHWRRDGTSFPVEYWARPVLRDGVNIGTVGTFIDISDRLRAERALRQANEALEERVQARTGELLKAKDEAERANLAKSEFLSRMSHELRTPLNAILGFSQLLQMRLGDEVDQRQVQEILAAGRHLLTLIDEVLDLARVESGRLSVSPEPVAVEPLVRECLGLVRTQAQARGIRLLEPGVEGDTHVRADRTRLKQVLLNLLSNAIKYNREGGSVHVACVPAGEGGRLQLRVHDSGPGLTPDQVSRLFVPFERLDAEVRRIPGTGIGLALSKRLAQLMDGELGVESAAGTGSTFWIDLPRSRATHPPASAVPHHPMPPRGAAGRVHAVLCIEDNPANLRLVETIFGHRPDLKLLSAMDPSLGLELARTQRPSLVLLDINLPDMDGFEVLRCLRSSESTRDIPVIALSASAMLSDLERAKAAGFDAYLTKPLDIGGLLAEIDTQITRRTRPAAS